MNSNNAKNLFQRGMAAGKQGQMDQAVEFFLAAAEQNPEDAAFLMEVGQVLENMKKPAMAANIYTKVLSINGKDVEALLSLGRVLLPLFKNNEAIQCFEQANKLQPRQKDILATLSTAYWANGENDKGEAALKDAFKLGLGPEIYYFRLADYYEKSNRVVEMGEILAEGLKVRPENHTLLVFQGAYYYHKGKYKKALETFLKVKGNTEFYVLNQRLHFELGRVYDKLGKYQDAFKSYTLGNKFAKAAAQLTRQNTEKGRFFIENVEGVDFTGWDGTVADTLKGPANNPIFLVGFPRSGTTLLNRILDTHKDIECIEEERILFGTKSVVTSRYGRSYQALKDLPKDQLNALRDHYLTGARQYKKSGQDIFMVDKMPLNISEIPFIQKIFPKAKIILAVRHPCDCTLSSFMQNFGLNQAMLNMLNLDDATSYYAEIMKQWLMFCSEFGFDYYAVKYEKLIQNPEKEIRALVSYLGLEWDPEIMNFTKKAVDKGYIKTPSHHQVVKPIYQDAKDRWRNYEKEMAPYLGRLKPYCDFFGYKI